MTDYQPGALARLHGVFTQYFREGDVVELLRTSGRFDGEQTWFVRHYRTGRHLSYFFRESQLKLLTSLEHLASVEIPSAPD